MVTNKDSSTKSDGKITTEIQAPVSDDYLSCPRDSERIHQMLKMQAQS